jgi:HD-like signal output (HDOD) protein
MNANPTTQEKQPHSLEEWAEMLRNEELPIFSNTAQKINLALNDRHKGAMELASIILQDPNLTAKLLKVGNTPYYNPSRQKISTVSRAIVILGVQLIRELTLACSFFESILSPANKERANKEIAQAIHAAVQARELAILAGDQSPEEVFVAALLHNVGEVAFWCCSNPHAAEIHARMARSGLEGDAAEKSVLGFSLSDLGKKLSKSWHLGGLIEDAIIHPESTAQRIQAVCMGSQICHALKQGIDSDEMAACLQKLQKAYSKSPDEFKAKIKANTLVAIDIARQFGAHDASKFIATEQEFSVAETHEDARPDKKLIQFQILQEITSHISGVIDLNALFEMVLEGVHRGVEMDRTLFMLLGPDKKALNEKISLGWQKPEGNEKIHIFNNDANGNLLFHALADHEGEWMKPYQDEALYTAQIQLHLGCYECFVFPILVEGKSIGLIYCDRGLSGQALTMEDFSAVKHFTKQAQIGLTLYRMKSH